MWIVWSCQMHSVWCNNLFFGMLVSEGKLLMSDVIRAFRKLFPMDGFKTLRDASKYIGLDMTYGCESSEKKLNLFGVYTPIREGFPSSIICHKLSSPSSEVTWHKWKISHNTRTKIDSLALNWCLTPSVWLIIPRRYFYTLLVIVIYLIL